MTSAKPTKSYGIGASGSASTGYPQCLLRRRPSLSVEEFQAGWLEHARVGMPWAMDCGMSHYVQIVNPSVANPSGMPPGVNMDDFDAVAELRIPDDAPGTETDKITRAAYFERVIIPDECRYFAGPNRDLGVWVPPGTMTGKRIEIVVDGEWVKEKDGKPVIDLTESTKVYEQWKKDWEAGKIK